MVTQKGANTCVAAIKGNFDVAQSAVKRIFTDNELKAELKKNGYVFSLLTLLTLVDLHLRLFTISMLMHRW